MLIEEVFQDEVIRATALNRGSGDVLNRALKRPVTIIRNEETFALMRRELATTWRKEASYAVHLTEIMWNALGHPASLESECQWISAFDDEDKQLMAEELMNSYRKATRDGSWDDLDAVIHEWSESGWAILNSDLKDAFDAHSEDIPLTTDSLVTA